MKNRILHIFFLACLGFQVKADVYLIFYATDDGNTGHCGIAVDNYIIRIQEYCTGGEIKYIKDTVLTGTLTYFDLWPEQDSYKGSYDKDVEAQYYKLPSQSHKQLISVRTLTDQGIPHKLGYPCDGLISISSTKKSDLQLISFLDDMIEEEKPFNAMQYNCCDFVVNAVSFLFDRKIEATEFIIKDYVTTPNQLFKEISSWPDVTVLKHPGKSIQGTFVEERILARFVPLLKIF